MVDSLKNLTGSSQPSESLRRNLKSISGGSVVRVEGEDLKRVEAEKALNKVADSVKLSADALRNLSNLGKETDAESIDVAEENIRSASASPDEVEAANQSAQRAGALIQFNKDEALNAHGERLQADRVFQLLR